jgi:hypothetical protein
MSGHHFRIAPEVVACIRDGREPDDAELRRVADFIFIEIRGTAPAFAWGVPGDDRSVDLITLAMARVALSGTH